MADRVDTTYRFEPMDTSGVFLGLGGAQCALLGGALLVSLIALTSELPLVLAALPVALAAVASFGRSGGRQLWQWIPIVAGWLVTGHGSRRRWFAPLPLASATEHLDVALPPVLQGIRILEVPWRGALHIGAIHDTERRTMTAVVRVAGAQFVVQTPAEQARLLAGWGDVLNQFAGASGSVVYVAWSDFSTRSGLVEHRRWLDGVDAGVQNDDASQSYEDLLRDAAAAATAHDVVVSLTVTGERHRRGEPRDGTERLARALVVNLEALLRGVRSAGLASAEPLAANDVRRLLRVRVDPASASPVLANGQLVDRLGLSSSSRGPLTTEAHWRHVRLDGAWHRTWWVEVWPRLPVSAAWLEPLLAYGGVTRTVTVGFQPVSTHQARRRIERDLVKLESDASVREEKGRRVDARHRRVTQALLDREQELVAGFAEMGYIGMVTVSAASEEELDAHGEVVEQLARECGMELRLLDGRQDVAWAAALPFGLAPRGLLAT